METIDGWLIGNVADGPVEIELVTDKAKDFAYTFLTQDQRVYIHRNYESIEVGGKDALALLRDMVAGGLKIR